MLDLLQAEQMLMQENLTCVVLQDDKMVFRSNASGLEPLMEYRAMEPQGRNRILVDRVVGRAAAYLAVSMGIRHVVTTLVCVGALDIFDQHAVQCTYRYVIRHVTDRSGQHQCEFDQTLEGIRNPDQALKVILRRWEETQRQEHGKRGKKDLPSPPLHSYR